MLFSSHLGKRTEQASLWALHFCGYCPSLVPLKTSSTGLGSRTLRDGVPGPVLTAAALPWPAARGLTPPGCPHPPPSAPGSGARSVLSTLVPVWTHRLVRGLPSMNSNPKCRTLQLVSDGHPHPPPGGAAPSRCSDQRLRGLAVSPTCTPSVGKPCGSHRPITSEAGPGPLTQGQAISRCAQKQAFQEAGGTES